MWCNKFTSWINKADKPEGSTISARAICSILIFKRHAILLKFDNPESKVFFTKICTDQDLFSDINVTAQIVPCSYPMVCHFVPCTNEVDPSNPNHLRERMVWQKMP
jgi:hypothetical protein